MVNLWDYEKRKKIRYDKTYKASNTVWNKYRLNKRENIGHTMILIKECKPNNFDEWQSYYEKSGQEAHTLKSKLTFHSFDELKKSIYIIDCEHGKTADDLTTLAKDFQALLKNEGMNLDLETCFNYVYIRAVDETYLGYQREVAAFNSLSDYCKDNNLTVKETSNTTDVRYGVDFEVFQKDKLLAGIQVKGSIYKKAAENAGGNIAIKQAEKLLHCINNEYSVMNKVPVLRMYVEQDLSIKDTKIFDDLKVLQNKNTIARDVFER